MAFQPDAGIDLASLKTRVLRDGYASAVKIYGSEALRDVSALLMEGVAAADLLNKGSAGAALHGELELGYHSAAISTFGDVRTAVTLVRACAVDAPDLWGRSRGRRRRRRRCMGSAPTLRERWREPCRRSPSRLLIRAPLREGALPATELAATDRVHPDRRRRRRPRPQRIPAGSAGDGIAEHFRRGGCEGASSRGTERPAARPPNRCALSGPGVP